jgi:hypothetical protein
MRTKSRNMGGGLSRYSNGGNSRKKQWPQLLLLAKQGKFETIEDILMRNSESDIFSWIENCSLSKGAAGLETFKGATTLHLIMPYHPPVEVVDSLIYRLSQKRPGTVPEDATDMQGRTPLHVAVAHGCDIKVVQRLMNGVVSAVPAVTKDAWNRLPLHWACVNENISFQQGCLFGCTPRFTDCDNMTKIVEALVKVYPHAVTVKDQFGMTPLDLAINRNADQFILHILHSALKSKSRAGVDHSNSGATEDTSMLNIPLEVSKSQRFDFDYEDDISSIGTGGASRYHRYRKKSASRPLPFIVGQIQI